MMTTKRCTLEGLLRFKDYSNARGAARSTAVEKEPTLAWEVTIERRFRPWGGV